MDSNRRSVNISVSIFSAGRLKGRRPTERIKVYRNIHSVYRSQTIVMRVPNARDGVVVITERPDAISVRGSD